jgi:hypothetical protein
VRAFVRANLPLIAPGLMIGVLVEVVTALGVAAAPALVGGVILAGSAVAACRMRPVIAPGSITGAALFDLHRGLALVADAVLRRDTGERG